ncbi:MAG TPA: ABC transporter ATP-binding protein [Acidimicrobiia bacterium]|nr:ABC transporter ATP-binding protein [Acidimicrobiia bacterium]
MELRAVRAGYGGITVLRGFDLAVPFGAVVALLGPNGGGKTTALRVIAGQLAATQGDVFVAGRRVNGADPDELARRGVCLVPEGRGIFPNLSVRENLWMATHTGVTLRHIEEIAYSRFAPLGARRKQLAGTLSGGEQQMLAMARALAVDPALLLLDELSMGLAPLVVEQLYEIVAGVAREGVAIVVVEQFARAILGIADAAGVVVRGRITTFGAPADVAAELSSAYLGESP